MMLTEAPCRRTCMRLALGAHPEVSVSTESPESAASGSATTSDRAPIIVFQVTISADPNVIANMQATARIRAEKEPVDGAPAGGVPDVGVFAKAVATALEPVIRAVVPMLATAVATELRRESN